MKITPSAVLMVKPFHFGYNEETAASNAFQSKPQSEASLITQKALLEFEQSVAELKSHGIRVLAYDQAHEVITPDAVFPNNWIGFHPENTLIIYPMANKNRRSERHPEIVRWIQDALSTQAKVIDISPREKQNEILEGTGSMIFDYKNGKVYGCLSPRTSKSLFDEVAKQLHMKPITFIANDPNGIPIYHTNVILTITEKLALVCLDSISDEKERSLIVNELTESGLKIVNLSFDQIKSYSGNMFEVKNERGVSYLVGSETAWNALLTDQLETVLKYHQPIKFKIPTIENIGGGSARCMVAGIHWSD